MRRKEQPLGAVDNLLFSLRSFVGGAHTPRFAHSAPPWVRGGLLSEYTGRGPDTGSLCLCFLYFHYAKYPLEIHGVSRDLNTENTNLGHTELAAEIL
jgi:hypothetical protein